MLTNRRLSSESCTEFSVIAVKVVVMVN